ncbi:MAG: efflux RND transporter periplasmic adaptor subunit [Gammaproteobacteria bacterium]|nr:efflux RND transporter periplasmic adaptor subunit [Gammaproteobacteria bacterium]TVQ48276.1 MAG: efflux RND transporter periplasmic adaptor subunit [Gammaproteobacteria bacterium]
MTRHVIPTSPVQPFLLLTALLTLAGCSPGTANDSDAEPAAPASVPVELATTTRGAVAANWTGTASLEVDEEATVVARVAGELVALLAEEGDHVAVGQVLARLDGDRLRLEKREAEANLGRLQRDYERNLEMFRRGLISSEAHEMLRFELDAMQAVYERRALEYEYTRIRAPIAGIIAERHVRVGNTINAGDPTFRITSRAPLLAYLFVPEREFARLSPGQPTEVQVDALGGARFTGRVKRISPVIDPATGTFRVTLEIPDPDDRLSPGMFGRFAVVYERREDVLLVPRAALLDTDGGDAVFVVNEGTARRQDVTTGFTSGEFIEITSGLRDGDEVVVVGQNALRDGTPVRSAGRASGRQP